MPTKYFMYIDYEFYVTLTDLKDVVLGGILCINMPNLIFYNLNQQNLIFNRLMLRNNKIFQCILILNLFKFINQT